MLRFTLKKAIVTVREEGWWALAAKAARRSRYVWRRLLARDYPGAGQWKALQGRFEGQRVFVIGNGPSLNRTPLYLLRDEHTMCFNHFYLMRERLNWSPTFYLAVDNLVLDDLVPRLGAIQASSQYLFLPDLHYRGPNYSRAFGNHSNVFWLRQRYGKGFSTDLPTVYPGGTVLYEGLQVLAYLGFREIVFLGVDMNFQIHQTARAVRGGESDVVSQHDDDPNHFDPRYFGTGRAYHQPKTYVVEAILESLDYVAAQQEALGIRILNAGYDSKLDLFPTPSLDDVLGLPANAPRALFDECFVQNTRWPSAQDFEREAIALEPRTDWRPDVGHVTMPAEDGIRCVSKAVFTHLPLGPFEGRYYFVRRDE